MLTTGGLLVSIALLALAAAARVFRSSNPPRWTTRRWIGELVTLAIVCILVLGLSSLGAGAIDAFQTGPDYLDAGLFAAVLFVSVMIWRRLSARAGVGAPAAAETLRAHLPGTREARTDRLVATAEGAPVTASEPTPPHKAA